ncbi:MAG: GNAT family N-acetyltransferase, partial [Candidatus Bathyarchaeota archaeon]|nr:GNAT family N-acetyltransferase [Candidatus Bathyarchaeota archaeon]
ITKFDEKINTFWNKIKDQYNFIVVKDKNYLNWRYCDLRGGDYEIRVVEENENILGYIVLRINRIKNEYPLGYIMEILTLPEHRDVAELLIKDAAHYFEKRSINSIHATIVKGHPSERLLRRYDFIDNREKIFVGVNPNNPENLGNELENFMHSTPDKLNYQYGESDTI